MELYCASMRDANVSTMVVIAARNHWGWETCGASGACASLVAVPLSVVLGGSFVGVGGGGAVSVCICSCSGWLGFLRLSRVFLIRAFSTASSLAWRALICAPSCVHSWHGVGEGRTCVKGSGCLGAVGDTAFVQLSCLLLVSGPITPFREVDLDLAPVQTAWLK